MTYVTGQPIIFVGTGEVSRDRDNVECEDKVLIH
jgi:hypothetical protein